MSRNAMLIGAAVGVVAALATTAALAAIPDSSGVVHACYQHTPAATKPVQLLDTGTSTKCPAGWSKVQWNVKGQRGAPGKQGVAGKPGPAGSAIVLDATAGQQTIPGGSGRGGPGDPGYYDIQFNLPTWTQAAGELDQIVAEATVTAPATCSDEGVADQPGIIFRPFLDGAELPYSGANLTLGGTQTVDIDMAQTPDGASGGGVGATPAFLFQPGTATSHTVDIKVQTDSDAQTYTLDSATVDVVGFH